MERKEPDEEEERSSSSGGGTVSESGEIALKTLRELRPAVDNLPLLFRKPALTGGRVCADQTRLRRSWDTCQHLQGLSLIAYL